MPAKRLCLIGLIAAMVVPCTSRAQDAASAKAFLISIYRHYQNGGKGIEFDGPRASLYFESSLLALEKADVKANGPDNVPAIDADPICSCQDYSGIWNLMIEVQPESARRARANVSFAVFTPKESPDELPTKLVITLVIENGGWRIWDILDDSDPKSTFSVRQHLQDDLATLRKNRASAPR